MNEHQERRKQVRRKIEPICDLEPDSNRRERDRRGSSDVRLVPAVVQRQGERRRFER